MPELEYENKKNIEIPNKEGGSNEKNDSAQTRKEKKVEIKRSEDMSFFKRIHL